MIKVFIGYDSREDIAYHVAKHSVLKYCPNALVYPLVMDYLRAEGVYTRGKDILASTAFATTRYLVPYLSHFEGLSLYMDCDMLLTRSVEEVFSMAVGDYPVWVVQNNFTPKVFNKMDNRTQVAYPKKGWMSFALFNCGHLLCKNLTPSLVNCAPIPYLNEMQWCVGDIGELPKAWNHLVRYHNAPEEDAKTLVTPTAMTPANIHFTLGGPWLEDQPDQDYDNLWRAARAEMELANAG